MRTDTFPSVSQVIDRVRGQSRRLAARVPASPMRWVVAIGAVLVIGSIVYVVTGTPTAAGAYIRGGTKFSDDDILAITGVLNAKHLPFRIVDDGRIEVSSDRLDDANDAIAKLEVGPRRLDDIEKKRAENWSLLETTEEKLERLEKANSEQLAGYIQRLPGIVSSRVKVNRGKGRDGRRVGAGPSAFVYLETQAKRVIPHRVVKSIQDLVVGNNPDVRPTAITIMDQAGHSYLDAQNPSLGVLSRQRAREEEYRDEIAKKLDWISGAEVSVQLLATAEAVSQSAQKPEAPPALAAEEVRLPELPKMSLNQPIEVEPDPIPVPTPSPTPVPAPAIVAEKPPEEDESASTRARVLVTVPRTFYFGRINSREPSLDDLQAIESRTEKAIKLAVAIVIPPERLAEVNVTRILDELPPTTPPPSANSDMRRSFSWWALAGVAITEVLTALGLAYGLMAGRWPVSRTVSRLRERDRGRDDRGRYKIDEAGTDSPGPSERVRELIRQNPEAAASVLHRWTGQGGPIG